MDDPRGWVLAADLIDCQDCNRHRHFCTWSSLQVNNGLGLNVVYLRRSAS